MKNREIMKRNESPFDALAKRFFGDDLFSFRPTLSLMNDSFNFNAGKTNIIENEKDYIVQVSVPGFKKDDINIELVNDVLTISSKMEDSKEETKDNYYRKEFVKSSFARSFVVPEDVNPDEIEAKMEDGILNVSIPKVEQEKKESKFSIKVK